MCNGQLPFETEQEILDYNLKMKTQLSDEYKELLFDCLKPDPEQRPKLADLLNYAWFRVHSQSSTSDSSSQSTSAGTSPNATNVNNSSSSSEAKV
jgi:serine/threonine protein kinase